MFSILVLENRSQETKCSKSQAHDLKCFVAELFGALNRALHVLLSYKGFNTYPPTRLRQTGDRTRVVELQVAPAVNYFMSYYSERNVIYCHDITPRPKGCSTNQIAPFNKVDHRKACKRLSISLLLHSYYFCVLSSMMSISVLASRLSSMDKSRYFLPVSCSH